MRMASRMDGGSTNMGSESTVGPYDGDSGGKSRLHSQGNPDRPKFRMTTHLSAATLRWRPSLAFERFN
jgi:hypothetical protein